MFKKGKFKLHSGRESVFKIECDSLTWEDLEALADIVSRKITDFHSVMPVPTTSKVVIDFSRAMDKYADIKNGKHILIVDDVLTTGETMENTRANYFFPDEPVIGVVIFARGKCPGWIHPIFELSELWSDV
jgi:orotate phosphoribosyltransferase